MGAGISYVPLGLKFCLFGGGLGIMVWWYRDGGEIWVFQNICINLTLNSPHPMLNLKFLPSFIFFIKYLPILLLFLIIIIFINFPN